MTKILIALQFWSGDREHAKALAQFIADVEDKHNELADILLVNRFDCPYFPEKLVTELARKFNVFQYRTRSRLTGWPAGCNGLWTSTMEWVRSMCYAGKAPMYKCVFTCEADGAPLCKDWILRLHSAWDRANSVSPVTIAGPMVGSDSPDAPIATHINGNCLVSTRRDDLDWILRTVPTVHPMAGWDYAMRHEFRTRGWYNLLEIQSLYNSQTFSPEEYNYMVAKQWVWVHGDKSGILIKYGRKGMDV